MSGAAGSPARIPGRLLLSCCLTGFACFFSSYLRVPILPLFALSLGAGTVQIGLINAAFMLSAGLLAIPAGILSDRTGQKPLLLTGLLAISASSLIIPLSTGPLMLGVVYLFFGAGLAAFTPAMMSLVADISPRDHLGRAYSFYTSAVYSGMTLGPAAGGLFGRAVGLRPAFLISGGLAFTAALFAFRTLPHREPARHRHGEVRLIGASLANLLANRRLTACLLGTLGSCFGFGVFVSFFPLQARAAGLDPGQTGLVFATYAVANAFLRIPFGRLSDRTDRGAMSAAGFTLFALALAGIGLCGRFGSLMLAAGILGTGMGFGFTALGALVADVVPDRERGFALGLYNSCIYLGMMFGSATMGGVFHRVGFRTGFVMVGTIVAGVTFLFLARYRRGTGYR